MQEQQLMDVTKNKEQLRKLRRPTTIWCKVSFVTVTAAPFWLKIVN
jgi:hypothetical protein